MKTIYFGIPAALLVLVAAATGCGKTEEIPPPQPVPEQPNPAAPATPTPAPAAQTSQYNAEEAKRQQAEAQAALKAAETAMRAREYERAAQALITVQRQQALTEQQSMAARDSMVKLQRDLANAMASGDPKAQAAAELLRRSTMR